MRTALGLIVYASSIVIGSITAAPSAPAPQAQTTPKNLKVLPKTWTLPQVRSLMQTFAESLGVPCGYCHAADPNAPPPPPGRPLVLDYALDTKGEKDDARRMIAMVMSINADYLKGLGQASVPEKVTCFTCHAGSEVPLSAPIKGWPQGGFSLLPAGPPPPARGGQPTPGAGRGGR